MMIYFYGALINAIILFRLNQFRFHRTSNAYIENFNFDYIKTPVLTVLGYLRRNFALILVHVRVINFLFIQILIDDYKIW